MCIISDKQIIDIELSIVVLYWKLDLESTAKEGFQSESDGQFSPYCSDQSSESDDTGNTEDDDSNNVPD